MHIARRFDGIGSGYDGTTRSTRRGTDWTGVVKLHEDRLGQPLEWSKSRRVFVDSMSDLFHPAVPFEFVDRVFAVMALASNHIFQILTKRPERMAEYLDAGKELWAGRWIQAAHELGREIKPPDLCFPLLNVWLGTSIEDDAVVNRIDELRQAPAQVRFLSLEPLIGPLSKLDLSGMHWVIAGGESGHGARPMHPEWARSIRDQCRGERVPFFFKQWGAWVPLSEGRGRVHTFADGQSVERVGKKKAGRELDGRTWDEMPEGTPEFAFA